MGYYINPQFGYHEGDPIPGDSAVPQRPNLSYQWTGSTWAMPLATAQAAQIAILLQSYQAAITQPVAYMSTTFQADPTSQANVQASLAALTPGGATLTGFYWVDANNNHVVMTLAQLQGLGAAMYSQAWTAFQTLQAQKAAVNAATTVATVQAIAWP